MLAALKLEKLSLRPAFALVDTRAAVLAALVLLLELRLHRLLLWFIGSQHLPECSRFLKVSSELGNLSCLGLSCMLFLFCIGVGERIPALFLAWLYAVILNECLHALEPFVQLVSLW